MCVRIIILNKNWSLGWRTQWTEERMKNGFQCNYLYWYIPIKLYNIIINIVYFHIIKKICLFNCISLSEVLIVRLYPYENLGLHESEWIYTKNWWHTFCLVPAELPSWCEDTALVTWQRSCHHDARTQLGSRGSGQRNLPSWCENTALVS